MATCDTCGKSFGLFEGSKGRCNECRNRNLTPENYADVMASDAKAEAAFKAIRDSEVRAGRDSAAKIEAIATAADSVLLTTESMPSGLTITKRHGIVTAECVFGMHMFKDMFAIGRDLFGGRSGALQNTLKDARNTALQELRIEAATLGANAVIAVDLDYSEISGGGKSMLFLVASGTAVTLAGNL